MKTTTRKAEYDADIKAIIAETRAGIEFRIAVANHWGTVSPLFRYTTPHGAYAPRPDGENCGCLTMIKSRLTARHAWTDEFTRIVSEDERIPDDSDLVTPLSLFAFRDLQMLADATFRRDYLLEQGLVQVIEEVEPVAV